MTPREQMDDEADEAMRREAKEAELYEEARATKRARGR